MYRLYDKSAGVEEIVANGVVSLRIYPNPVEDEAIIESQQDIKSIAIYNMAGAMVQFDYTIDGNKARVNLSSLPAGIYFANINNGIAKIVKK